MTTLKAIEDSNMIFISAQPDTSNYHWKVELYMYQFAKYGIGDRCYAIFGYTSTKPSEYAIELSKRYNIYFYRIIGDLTVSVGPNLLKQFFQQFPELGNCVFYHESDILFANLPKFELMLDTNYGHLSDNTSQINYTYIHTAANRYKAEHKTIEDDDIFTKMCRCIDISEDLVRKNNSNSGGGQYLLKRVTSDYWANVEIATDKLYSMLKDYNTQYVISNPIDLSNVSNWAVLWEYWKLGKETRVSLSPDCFYSGSIYTGKNLFEDYILNRNMFLKDSPPCKYARVLKDYVDSDEYIYTKSFILLTKMPFGGLYKEDPTVLHGNRAIWRSMTRTHLIFYNSVKWVLIESSNEITDNLEGLASNNGIYPYSTGWDIECKILKG